MLTGEEMVHDVTLITGDGTGPELAVDIVIVRENSEDLYAGVELEAGKPETAQHIDYINSLPSDKKIKPQGNETGVSIKPISISGAEHIVRCAFEHASKNGCKKVTAVIAEGKDVTYDMKPIRTDPTAVGTREMAEAICRRMAG